MTSGHVLPSETSPTKATTGLAVQLSASSVTTFMSATGAVHCAVIAAGLLAVGNVVSSIVIFFFNFIVFPDLYFI